MTDPTHAPPGFSAQAPRQTGLSLPSSLMCDGQDRHQLGMPRRQAVIWVLAGAALIGLDLVLHRSARALSTGIGLLLVPLVGALFARWVDGPVLYYRSWGRLHRLPLSSVTAVMAGKSKAASRTVALGALMAGKSKAASRTVALGAPGLAKPLRITLRSRGYVMSTAARQHLRGWLSAPHVQWTAEAVALFNDDIQPAPPVRRRRLLTLALAVAVGAGGWLIIERPSFAITGAPGYSTFSGPDGDPLPLGRPWGRPCQPILFTVEEHVPDWVYAQVATIVSEAREDGIDVTLETRQFRWSPSLLFYVDGQSRAATVTAAIFAHHETPPKLANGQPQHITLDWDTRPDPDGHNEDLTRAYADLWMQTLNGHPQAVRRSVRQLIAMTQGVLESTQPDSAIRTGSLTDHFTRADVEAMQRMSGCGHRAVGLTGGA